MSMNCRTAIIVVNIAIEKRIANETANLRELMDHRVDFMLYTYVRMTGQKFITQTCPSRQHGY
jgi:hypothetical protein